MTTGDLWALAEDSRCNHAAQMLAQHDIGALPVLADNGRLVGIVTDRDLCCRVLAQGREPETPVRDIMSTNVHCVQSDADIEDVESVMRQFRVRRVPVV
ncbi:MAG: CBS domain-containing protein, partial [Lentisphaerae bacterium]|nr:CBS domain-containing protein [Lentisphaerota bacterium]